MGLIQIKIASKDYSKNVWHAKQQKRHIHMEIRFSMA